jgi:hypothetical protein
MISSMWRRGEHARTTAAAAYAAGNAAHIEKAGRPIVAACHHQVAVHGVDVHRIHLQSKRVINCRRPRWLSSVRSQPETRPCHARQEENVLAGITSDAYE